MNGPIDFPAFNASLNALSGVLLVLGFVAVKAHRITLHKACMVTALATSTLFLACYLYYHIIIRQGEPTRFRGPDEARMVYYAILGSHTLLAMTVAPLALYTAYHGLWGDIRRHRWIARWTLPIWFYVSVTGVVVYWMLYRMYPTS